MMRRFTGRPAVAMVGLALLAASCGGDTTATTSTSTPAAETSTTTSTTAPVADQTTAPTTAPESSTTLPTETTEPASPPLAREGDRNETVEAFQFLLNCNGFGDLTVDGVFGPATLAAVKAAQVGFGQSANGAPDDETLAELSRSCAQRRRLDGEGVVTVIGNTSPEDPEAYAVALLAGSTIRVDVTEGTGITVAVVGADGADVPMAGESTWEIETTQDYVVEVTTEDDPVTFALAVDVTEAVQELGDWILGTNGITYRGTTLALGADAQTVINRVIDFLGHGVRGPYDEFDTGWYPITEPQDMGLRGLFIEGLAFLFFGPDPNNLDRPETLQRIRFVGPSDDASGEPRPDNYVTTAEGITVGDTVTDLKAAYGGGVTLGSNSNEYYYRFTDAGGELCFYFDTADSPTDFSPISEVATECRAG